MARRFAPLSGQATRGSTQPAGDKCDGVVIELIQQDASGSVEALQGRVGAATSPAVPLAMSLVNLAHVCSHLQNASRGRLELTSIPLTKLNLALMLQLQQQGFISKVVPAGMNPPEGADMDEPKLPPNPALRRLWLGLKYWESRPVLRKMSLVTKSRRRINLKYGDLLQIANGTNAGYVYGLREMGECMFVKTDLGVLELRECLERRRGGEPLCRVY